MGRIGTGEVCMSGANDLVWGVKRSFRDYVVSAGGTVRGDACGPDPASDPFTFVEDEATPTALRYRGEVAFEAHGGMLSVSVIDPWVEHDEHGAVLSVVDTGYLPERGHRVRIARLEFDGDGARDRSAVAARLTVQGCMLFGGVYPAHTELDPLDLSAARLPDPCRKRRG